ncbi:MAG: hypothetical protein HOY79_38235 [Streptomyces sp.]|nr:hypothetical protein [Streptomyces sp.]
MSESGQGQRQPTAGELPPQLYRIADSVILIGVRQTERGPEPLYAEVGGELCGVAYTDPEEIRADLPDDYHLYQIKVTEFLAQLPAVCGLLIDPRCPSPTYVAPYEREVVLAAGLPFPAGATIYMKRKAHKAPRLFAALLPRVQAIAELRRLYCTQYKVADRPQKLLMVYDAELTPGADKLINDAIIAAAAEIQLPDPMQIIAVDDLPEHFRKLVRHSVEPFYVRPDVLEEI